MPSVGRQIDKKYSDLFMKRTYIFTMSSQLKTYVENKQATTNIDNYLNKSLPYIPFLFLFSIIDFMIMMMTMLTMMKTTTILG